MRRTAMEQAFQRVEIADERKLTPLQRRIIRVMVRREKWKQQFRKPKGR